MGKGCLVLETGEVFEGTLMGNPKQGYGEVVFHTGMTGYQEVLTDPSYAGQIVVMTYPLIGNYGINPEDFESHRPWLSGFITAEAYEEPSHWLSTQSLSEFLSEHGITGLTGVDTRTLVKTIRTKGTMKGWILPMEEGKSSEFADLEFPVIKDQVKMVSTSSLYKASEKGTYHVIVIDFGVKKNIVQSLVNLGCKVTVVPAASTYEEIRRLTPDGIFLSNGPGDPADCVNQLPVIRKLAQQYPLMGICLGHQLLSMAFGAAVHKMLFGHRGSNHPVKDLSTGRISITSQNHGYAVLDKSVPDILEVTHIHVNDGSIEGVRVKGYPAFSVQFHPEACPGPHDSAVLFEQFLNFMAEREERQLVYATS